VLDRGAAAAAEELDVHSEEVAEEHHPQGAVSDDAAQHVEQFLGCRLELRRLDEQQPVAHRLRAHELDHNAVEDVVLPGDVHRVVDRV